MRKRYQQGSVYREGDVWRFRYYERDLSGKVQRPSVVIGTVAQYPTKAKATKAAEGIRQRVNDSARVALFTQLCDKYKATGMPTRGATIVAYSSCVEKLRAKWGTKRLDWIASPEGIMQIELWFRGLELADGRPMALGSRQSLKKIMKRMVDLAMKWGLLTIQRNPIELVELRGLPLAARTKRGRAILTVEQYRLLISDSQLPEYIRTMMQVGAMTGMGASEFLGLQWGDVDFGRGLIWVRRSAIGRYIDEPKTAARAASVPMHDDLAALLRRWKLAHPVIEDWVFGSAITKLPYNRNSMQQKHVQPAGARHGIEGLGWHSFRHFYRALMRKLGAPLEVQKNLMRHSTIAMTTHYGNDDATRAEEGRPYNAQVIEMLKAGGMK